MVNYAAINLRSLQAQQTYRLPTMRVPWEDEPVVPLVIRNALVSVNDDLECGDGLVFFRANRPPNENTYRTPPTTPPTPSPSPKNSIRRIASLLVDNARPVTGGGISRVSNLRTGMSKPTIDERS